MPKAPRERDDATAKLALGFIDLRAHFEAQLAVTRAEQCLLKCRGTKDAAAFDAGMGALRVEVQTIAENRRIIGDVLTQIIADVGRRF